MAEDSSAPIRRQPRWARSAQDAAEAAHRPDDVSDWQESLGEAAGPLPESDRATARRSTPVAVLLTVLVVLGAAIIVIAVSLIAEALAGSTGFVVGAYGAQIAVLAFVTVRAYPPEAKIPWAILVVVTILISALLPLVYLAWLWTSRKKWVAPEVARIPAM